MLGVFVASLLEVYYNYNLSNDEVVVVVVVVGRLTITS